MAPTLLPQDHLFGVERPLAGAVKRQDLWEVNLGVYGIARVIGLPGDDIQIRVGKLVLNGIPINGPYVKVSIDGMGDFPLPSKTYDDSLRAYHERAYGGWMNTGTVYRVPAGHYFMLNNNRKELWDSRLLGPCRAIGCLQKFCSVGGILSSGCLTISGSRRDTLWGQFPYSRFPIQSREPL